MPVMAFADGSASSRPPRGDYCPILGARRGVVWRRRAVIASMARIDKMRVACGGRNLPIHI